jgi:hypothetical protein
MFSLQGRKSILGSRYWKGDIVMKGGLHSKLLAICFITVMSIVFGSSVSMAAPLVPLNQTVDLVANYYINSHIPYEGFTGSVAAGMIQAYQIKGNASYKQAAASYALDILKYSQGNYYGDEAYALARLTVITSDQSYATLVRGFYDSLNTKVYARGFRDTDASNAVFYVAYNAVAAKMVGAKDADLWRQFLIYYLSQIADDTAYYPVMSLGVATWALALTGPMDSTMIDPTGLVGEDYWQGVKLSDLPSLLLSHQLSSGIYQGSFYIRFDHTAPSLDYQSFGYTEDAIYGALGLIATNGLEKPDKTKLNFDAQIQSAREALAYAVGTGGAVRDNIWNAQNLHYAFGGELLQCLSQ